MLEKWIGVKGKLLMCSMIGFIIDIEYYGDVKRVVSLLNVLLLSYNSDCKSRKLELFFKGVVVNVEYLLNLELYRVIKVNGKSVVFGLGIVFIIGLCYVVFLLLFNVVIND